MIDAMKQALEALEDVQGMMNTSEWFNERVTALHQAIEAAEKQTHTDHLMRHWDRTCQACLAEEQERNFCERCGKRLGDNIHTCTPPEAEKQEPVTGLEIGAYKGSGLKATIKHTDLNSLPSFILSPRKEWVGLNGEELAQLTIDNAGYPTRLTAAIEAKLKEKNYD